MYHFQRISRYHRPSRNANLGSGGQGADLGTLHRGHAVIEFNR